MKKLLVLLSPTIFLSGLSNAWGQLGHRQIGILAESLLTPETSEAISQLIPQCTTGCLGRISPWADKIKSRKEYSFSKTLHYINTGDNPPLSCTTGNGFHCLEGVPCIIDAIHNYTQQITNPKLNRPQRADALKFLVHYIEDIHQPLHLTGKLRGGNGAAVIWNKKRSNLHRVWDSQIMTKRIQDSFDRKAPKYLEYLLGKINGDWSVEKQEWLGCSSGKDIVCPQQWGMVNNRLNCDIIWKFEQGEDLAGSYFDRLVEQELPDRLLAMAAVRLASALNLIFASSQKDPIYLFGYEEEGSPSSSKLRKQSVFKIQNP